MCDAAGGISSHKTNDGDGDDNNGDCSECLVVSSLTSTSLIELNRPPVSNGQRRHQQVGRYSWALQLLATSVEKLY